MPRALSNMQSVVQGRARGWDCMFARAVGSPLTHGVEVGKITAHRVLSKWPSSLK